MPRRGLTVARVEDIKRLIAEGQSNKFIARALKCRRTLVAELRAKLDQPSEELASPGKGPLWIELVDWKGIGEEISQGFELRRIWEEKASPITSYSNFWKTLQRKFPHLLKETVTLRDFAPGSQCEVDYAGDKIEWINPQGEIFKAHIFIGALAFSQYLFAWASEDEKSRNWLSAHQKMYSHFQGVPAVTVCDCLKNGVIKAHRYDPDLNPAYTELATHYGTAIVPARPRRPKDKSIVEGAVKLIMRLFRWNYRRHTFFSLDEINRALSEVVKQINERSHTRFRTSRLERWQLLERKTLKDLPDSPFESIEWTKARVHPDSTISVDQVFYSVPYLYRGKEVRVKLTQNQVEIFYENKRLAIHSKHRRHSTRVIQNDHLPPNSQAYREATPQNLLSQARFIHSDLRSLVDDLFNENTLGNLRRVQGLLRVAQEEIKSSGRALAEPRIVKAIEQMRRFEKIRVTYFRECLNHLKKQQFSQAQDFNIQRMPGNPMLRQAAVKPEVLI
jgi:hypothetical protein